MKDSEIDETGWHCIIGYCRYRRSGGGEYDQTTDGRSPPNTATVPQYEADPGEEEKTSGNEPRKECPAAGQRGSGLQHPEDFEVTRRVENNHARKGERSADIDSVDAGPHVTCVGQLSAAAARRRSRTLSHSAALPTIAEEDSTLDMAAMSAAARFST